MRLLMTADAVGGVWTYALELADSLAQHDVEVHVATMGPLPSPDQREAARRSAVAGLHESCYALEWEEEPWEDVRRAGEWLLELADELGVDLVHLNGYAHATLPWRVPVVVVSHSDVLSWRRAVHGTPPPEGLEHYRQRVEAGLRRADAVCAPTRSVLDDLAASYRFEKESFVVPNGRSPAGIRDVEKEPLVVGVGRFWDEAKNVAALQRIAPRLPWPVVLGGPHTPVGRLTAAQTAALLARASIFVSPARYEPFGLTPLEAAQAGCALVLGNIPSLREVWGDAASYVPPDDDEAILRTVSALCHDDESRRELAARGAKRAARYTPAAMAEGMRSVYGRVLAGVPA
jgi:glycogen synthase